MRRFDGIRCASALLAAWLLACGGRVEGPGTGTPAPSSSSSTGSSDNAGSSGGSFPMHDLGACVPGFDRAANPSQPCPWVSENGVCFASEDTACARICPRDGNSLCSSGPPSGPTHTTTVYCDKI